MGRAPKYKTFDGKEFKWEESSSKKTSAQRAAKRYRNQGRYVRVIKTTDKTFPWAVYTRAGRKKISW